MGKSFSRYNGEFPRQLVVMVNDETGDRVEAEAVEPGASKSGVIRHYLELGIKRHDALERAKGKPATAAPLDGPTG